MVIAAPHLEVVVTEKVVVPEMVIDVEPEVKPPEAPVTESPPQATVEAPEIVVVEEVEAIEEVVIVVPETVAAIETSASVTSNGLHAEVAQLSAAEEGVREKVEAAPVSSLEVPVEVVIESPPDVVTVPIGEIELFI